MLNSLSSEQIVLYQRTRSSTAALFLRLPNSPHQTATLFSFAQDAGISSCSLNVFTSASCSYEEIPCSQFVPSNSCGHDGILFFSYGNGIPASGTSDGSAEDAP